MKRSNVIFLALAVVVAVGVVAVYMNYPPVNGRDAQGTIGAVQKYRTEQIKSTDVVLGDEASRRAETATYGEFLAQATQLQALSADLASFEKALGSREAVASRNVAEAKTQVESLTRTIDSRYNGLAARMLELTSSLAARQDMQGFRAELAAMQNTLQNRNNVGVRELESMQASLGRISASLGVKNNLEALNRLEATNRLDAINKMEARELVEAQASLAAVTRELAAKDADLGVKVQSIEKQLGAVSAVLGKTAEIANRDRDLQSAVQQLGLKFNEAKTLFQAKADLAAIERSLGKSADLAARDAELSARDAELSARDAELAARNAELAARNAEVGSRSAELSARDAEIAARADLAAISNALGAKAAELESLALLAMQSRLQARSNEAKTLVEMKATVESVSREIGSRFATGSRSQEFAGVKSELAAIEKALASRNAELGARLATGARAEIAAISNYLEARTEVASRNAVESKQNLEAMTSVASRSNMESRSNALGIRNLEGFTKYLGSLDSALESRNTSLADSDRADLGTRADALQSRAAEMQAKFNQ